MLFNLQTSSDGLHYRIKNKKIMTKWMEQLYSKQWWLSWISILIGCTLVAAGFVFFATPYKIVPGGVYGLGVVLHHLIPSIKVGTFGFMFDIPLLLIGTRVFGKMFGARTIIAAILTPTIMNLLTMIVGDNPTIMLGGKADLTNDMIIACIFGGVLLGAGVGLVIKHGGTTGGTDIVAMLLNKYTRLPIARGVLIGDSLVVIFGMIVLGDWRLPLYSLVTIFVSARVIDYVIDGASYDKLLFIISEKHEQLKKFILEDLERGATYIKSSGMYTKNDKDMIFLVISRRELSAVQNKIKEIDPDSFLVVVDAHETYGDGFKSFQEKA